MKQNINKKSRSETFDTYEMSFINRDMASHAFKDGEFISKVTIMIFSEDFLFGGEIRFL